MKRKKNLSPKKEKVLTNNNGLAFCVKWFDMRVNRFDCL